MLAPGRGDEAGASPALGRAGAVAGGPWWSTVKGVSVVACIVVLDPWLLGLVCCGLLAVVAVGAPLPVMKDGRGRYVGRVSRMLSNCFCRRRQGIDTNTHARTARTHTLQMEGARITVGSGQSHGQEHNLD